MKPKHIVTAILFAFVAASVVLLVMKELRPGTPGTIEPAQSAAPADGTPPVAQESAGDAGESAAVPAVSASTIVYYLHGTRRCPTCRKLEEYTREAVMSGFAEDVKAGTIVWRAINTDDPGNEHYVKDYVLSTKSVVLSAVTGGTETRWRNLPRIWDLVGDKATYIAYIQEEIKTFQEGK